MHQNINGLFNKIDALQICLLLEDVDVLCLSEHHLRSLQCDMVLLENYTLESFFCRQTQRKGGVGIFVKAGVISMALNVIEFCIEGHCELAAVELKLLRKRMIVITVYRPPSGNINIFFTQMTELLEHIFDTNKFIMITGDFNIDCSEESSIDTKRLIYLMKSFNFYPSIFTYTREFKNSKSIIDNIFTNIPKGEIECFNLVTSLSDHYAQISILRSISPMPDVTKYLYSRSFLPCQVTNFKIALQQEPWSKLYFENYTNIDYLYGFFQSILEKHFLNSFPLKKRNICISKCPSHINISKQTMEIRKQLKHLYIQSKNLDSSHPLRIQYQITKKDFRKMIRIEKNNVFNQKVSNSKNISKTYWEIINSHRNNSKSSNFIDTLQDNNGGITNKPEEIATLFNDHFINITQDMSVSHKAYYSNKGISDSLFMSPTSEAEVIRIINSLKTSNTAGFDGTSTKLLKACSSEMSKPLTYLINKSISTGKFPKQLKKAIVKP
uniref:Endonuclease/exonuclease/phosphatase domain-containing protein n=1 Tax=Graphocephala atropunctata TaxID=36148 RepID=A0A1B6KQP0_9HEMI